MKHVVIVGPTASGKTALSIQIAQKYNGEIITADSRTVYKGMDIGTAKPTSEEQSKVKHHCLDLVYPNEPFTVADYSRCATVAREEINSKGKLDIIVGGSGLFVDGFVYSYSFTPPNNDVRIKYQDWGISELQLELQRLDIPLPLNYQNKVHLLHALERKDEPLPSKKPLVTGTIYIGVLPPKEVLLKQITERAYKMIELGVEKEIRELYALYGADCAAFNGGVYKSFRPYMNGVGSLDAAIEDTIKSDVRLAKKQITWFKRSSDITWFSSADDALLWIDSNNS